MVDITMNADSFANLDREQRRQLLLLMLVATEHPESLGRTANKRPHRFAHIFRQAFIGFSQRPRIRR